MNRSIADFEQASRGGASAAESIVLLGQADRELRNALPLAARANSADGTWNALMTTISESAVVDEGHLVPALRAQCVLADANENLNPLSPGPITTSTTAPANVNPRPASPAG